MKGASVLLAVLLVLGGCGARPAPEDGESLTLPGVSTPVTLYRPAFLPAPGLLLLAEAPREYWEPFALRARQEGYLVLLMQMHADAAGADAEIGRAKEALLSAGADANNVGLGGDARAGNVALQYAARDPQVQAVFMLSPGLDYRGVKPEFALQELGRRPVLFIAAENDAYSAASASALKEQAESYSELRMFRGAAHGGELLAAHASAGEQILEWLRPILMPLNPGE